MPGEKKTVVVTGAAGYLGRLTVRRLADVESFLFKNVLMIDPLLI